jgi:hypothetical protein
MDIDTKKIDETVLGLLHLTLHDGARAWKGFDWDTMNRLHQNGFISDPVPSQNLIHAKSNMLSHARLQAWRRPRFMRRTSYRKSSPRTIIRALLGPPGTEATRRARCVTPRSRRADRKSISSSIQGGLLMAKTATEPTCSVAICAAADAMSLVQ